MSRIRTIKPGFFLHADLYDLEREYGLPIRVAFAGLWTVCDRDGRFVWRPRELKPQILPHDDLDFAVVLDALERKGFVVRYEVAGAVFGFIPSWSRHQKPNHRERTSEIPAPAGFVDEVPARVMAENELPFPVQQNQQLDAWTKSPGGRGREGKGKGTERGNGAVVNAQTENLPPNLPAIEYARRLLDELGMPQKGNIFVVADSIRAFATSKGFELFAAFEQLRAIAHGVRDRGDPITHFWFQDGRYNNPIPRSKSDVATAEYANRLTREIEILNRSRTGNA